MKLSSHKYKPPLKSSEDVFDDMVKKLIQTNFGASRKSVISEELYLGPNNKNNMNEFLGQFRKFIKEYDGAVFMNSTTNNTNLPRVLCTDDVIRVLFYDLLHDGVVKKGDFVKFKKNFKDEFISFRGEFQIDFWAGAKTTANSYGVYKSILKMNKTRRSATRQIPAICKTLGDLSQFMYASKYDTIVASGDKMGIATGLYVNARSGKKVKVMMEDVITGFIIYTGLPGIKFVPKSTCTKNSTNSGACKNNGIVNKNTVANRIRVNVPKSKENTMKKIIEKKPKGFKRMLKLILNAAKIQRPENVLNTLKTFNSFKKYMDVDDLTQVSKILNVYKNKEGINKSTVSRIFEQIGYVSAKLNVQSNNKNDSNVKKSPNSMKSPPVASQPRRPGSAPARIRASTTSTRRSTSQIPSTAATTATPRTATPRTATPRTATPRTATPRTATPRTATPRTAATTAGRSPRTRPGTRQRTRLTQQPK
jgi:hypothetical protein